MTASAPCSGTVLNGGEIVKYKGEYFLYLGNNSSGFARLLDSNLNIYSGTPKEDKLEHVKTLDVRYVYRNKEYVETKQGMISLTTGKVMTSLFTSEIKRLGELVSPY